MTTTNGHTNGTVPATPRPVLNISPADRQWFESLVTNGPPFQFRNDFLSGMWGGNDPRLNAECKYPETGRLSPEFYRDLYDRDSYACRVVQLMAKECMQGQPTVFEDTDAEVSTPFEEAWDGIAKGLQATPSFYQDEQGSLVWDYLMRGDILSGIGQFGVILLGIDDGRNLQDAADGVEVFINNAAGYRVALPDAHASSAEVDLYHDDLQNKRIDNFTFNSLRKSASRSRETCLQFDADLTATFNKITMPGGEPGNGPFIQGTDTQYQTSFGLGMPFPKPAITGDWRQDLSGTEQQYFGVQFGPSQYFGKPAKGRKLLFMRIFDESLIQVVRYEWNIRNPRFGMPVMYRITLNDPRQPHSGVGLPLATVYVHWSRVVHLADNLHSSEIFGVPRLQPVLNNILNIRKVLGAGSEGYWKAAFTGISLETNPQLGGDVLVDEPKTRQMMFDYFAGLQRDLLLRGMTAKTLSPVVNDPTPHIAANEQAICVRLGCPIRVFRGSERGELASSQDDEAWNERKRERQINYMTPRVVCPVIDRLIQLGVVPQPRQGKDRSKPNPKITPPAGGAGGGGKGGSPSPGGIGSSPTAPTAGTKFQTNMGVMEVIETGARNLIIVNKAGEQVGVVTPGGYSVLWPDLDALGDKDKATIALTKTQAVAAYIAGSCEQLIPPSDYLTKVLLLEDEDAHQMLEDAENLAADQQADHADMAAEQGFEPTPPPGFSKPEPMDEDDTDTDDEGDEDKPKAGVVLKPDEKMVHPETGKGLAQGNKPVKPAGKKPPTKNQFCATGPGGGIDPSCTGMGTKELEGSKGIDRKDMPQLPKKFQDDLVKWMKGRGIKVTKEKVPVTELKPLQHEYLPAKVAVKPTEALQKPIIVSKGGRIMDGTHHWMKAIKEDWTHVPIIRLHIPWEKAFAMMHKFPKTFTADLASVTNALAFNGECWIMEDTGEVMNEPTMIANAQRTHHAIKRDLIAACQRLVQHPLATPGYGALDMKNDGSGEVWWIGGDNDGEGFKELVTETLEAIDGITKVNYYVGVPPEREAIKEFGSEPIWDEVWVNDGRDYAHTTSSLAANRSGFSRGDRTAGGHDARDSGDIQWITVKGQHIPIKEGQSVREAMKQHFDNLKSKGKSNGKEKEDKGVTKARKMAKEAKAKRDAYIKQHGHGPEEDLGGHGGGKSAGHGGGHGGDAHPSHGAEAGHHSHGHEFEHAGHEAHAAHESHELAEVFGGHEEAHAAVAEAHQAAHEAGHAAAETAKGAGKAAADHGIHAGEHPTGLDAAAIIGRQLYGPALRAAAKLVAKLPSGRGERVARAITALHDGATRIATKAVTALENRYGHATTAAILGAGSLLAHHVTGAVGLHGPLAKAIPAPNLVGAIPLVALAEVGKRLGYVGHGTKLEKGLETTGTWIHAVRAAIGRPFKAAGQAAAMAGLRGAKVAGKVVREGVRRAQMVRMEEDHVRLSPQEIDAEAKKLLHHLKSEYGKLVAQHKKNLTAAQR